MTNSEIMMVNVFNTLVTVALNHEKIVQDSQRISTISLKFN